ncbi:unnamed protein product [Hermetia illucens]|uniref:Uncharacterized protein n=1 Tax=Hermetia illucens TaxID=343691 RepID=A0A7R8YSU4_HERIL|nr:uncharacterized protein LOC119651305 [Hermetia illucens]CAD7084232.1 unnamed protein product [Hermetia illucens]
MSFQWKWLRNFVRRNTNPIPEYRAQRWRQRLSLAYILLAWNAFGLVCYMVYTGRNDWAKYYGYKSEEDASVPPSQYYANLLKVDKAKVIRFSGFQKVNEIEIDNTAEETKTT